jgi:hypothetical protein
LRSRNILPHKGVAGTTLSTPPCPITDAQDWPCSIDAVAMARAATNIKRLRLQSKARACSNLSGSASVRPSLPRRGTYCSREGNGMWEGKGMWSGLNREPKSKEAPDALPPL